jgi:hypothetical protein
MLHVATFRRVLQEYFPNVRFLNSSQLGRCTDCYEFKQKRAALHPSTEEYKTLDNDYQAHRNLASAERLTYQEKRLEAEQWPQSVLSLILDGSHGAYVPWIRNPPSHLTAMWRVPFTIFSSIDHGHKDTEMLIVPPFWSHDPNMFLSILHQDLLRLLDTGHRLGQPTLYLQLDNCVRENKNNYVFAYLAYLIRTGGKRDRRVF